MLRGDTMGDNITPTSWPESQAEPVKKPVLRGATSAIVMYDEASFQSAPQQEPALTQGEAKAVYPRGMGPHIYYVDEFMHQSDLVPRPLVLSEEPKLGGEKLPADQDRVIVYEDEQNRIYSVGDGTTQYEIAYLKKNGVETRTIVEFDRTSHLYPLFGVTEKSLAAILMHRLQAEKKEEGDSPRGSMLECLLDELEMFLSD